MAWPMALRAVMMFSIVIIDLYLVSSLGDEAVASIGIATVISGLLMGTTFAFANATQIKVAQAFGTQKSSALTTAFICGLIINSLIVLSGIGLILIFGNSAIQAMAHSQNIAEGASGYLRIFLLVMLVESLSAVLTSFFNGCGRTRLALYSFLISAPVNIGSSILLIFGLYGFPELGLQGAAWGSFLGAALRLLYLTWRYLTFEPVELHPLGDRAVRWLPEGLTYSTVQHFKFSCPIAITFVSMTFANQVCMAIYANMSVSHFAAMTLIMPWVRIAGQLSYTWTQATGILVAQMLGNSFESDQLDEFLSRAWRGAFKAASVVAIIYALIVFSTGWVYSDLSAETRAALFSFLPILLLLPFPRVSNAICGNVLRAGGDSKSSMNIHLIANWLFMVPVTALCVLILELPVVWVFALFLVEEMVKFPMFHRRIWTKQWHTLDS